MLNKRPDQERWLVCEDLETEVEVVTGRRCGQAQGQGGLEP